MLHSGIKDAMEVRYFPGMLLLFALFVSSAASSDEAVCPGNQAVLVKGDFGRQTLVGPSCDVPFCPRAVTCVEKKNYAICCVPMALEPVAGERPVCEGKGRLENLLKLNGIHSKFGGNSKKFAIYSVGVPCVKAYKRPTVAIRFQNCEKSFISAYKLDLTPCTGLARSLQMSA